MSSTVLLRVRRAVVGPGGFLLAAWAGAALLAAYCAGFRAQTLLDGAAAPARMAAEILRPRGREFHGLPDSPAVAMLRTGFGEGVSASDGRKLYDLAVARGYRRAVDAGTARGYAAIWLGLAMRRTGGKVVTIEIDAAAAEQARENIRRAGLSDVVESRIADALVEIPTIAGEFDLAFLDLGGPYHKKMLDLVAPRLAPGGAVVAHNGYFLRFIEPEYVWTANRDLETRIVPTLSGGMAVSFRRQGRR